MSSKILVIGESCKDIFYYGEVNRFCPEAPVPVFKVNDVNENGGMAKNVQCNLQALGNEVDLLTNENWELVTKTRYVHSDSNYMFLRVDKNDDEYGVLTIDRFKQIDLLKYDAIVVSDYDKGFLTEQMLNLISKSHKLVFLDTKKFLRNWCRNFSFIKINSKEYSLTKHTINNIIQNRLIVTRGPHGCVYRNKIYPVENVEIKDTSGAGDTFISGLCSMFCKTSDIDKSIKFANDCATSVVQKRGVSVV